MKETKVVGKGGFGLEEIYTREFNSLIEFYSYIKNTPYNEAFKDKPKHSVTGTKKFTGTDSYTDAEEMFLKGCPTLTKKIVKEVDKIKLNLTKEEKKTIYDVCGYQPSVPKYLQGIPNNMFNSKMRVVKQKVVTVNKMISYNCRYKQKEIINESLKALNMIRILERSGLRVNLNLLFVISKYKLVDKKTVRHIEVLKIRLKNSNEKLNLSKLVFPLVHPSMIRRLIFRYIEVAPTITEEFTYEYGIPISAVSTCSRLCKGEYCLPLVFGAYRIDEIKENGLTSLADLTKYFEK